MADATVAARAPETTGHSRTQQVDAAVVGAGFGGLYLLHRLRQAGFTTVALRRPTTSAGPGTGTGIPARAATFRPLITATPSMQAGERVEMVGKIRNPARNFALPRLRR